MVAEQKKKRAASGSGPFRYVNSINEGKTTPHIDGDDGNNFSDYVPFIVNRAMSQFYDTVLISNEMNMRAGVLSSKQQYSFFKNLVRPKKRFSKWAKKEKQEGIIMSFAKVLGVSYERGSEYWSVFTESQKSEIKRFLNTGGIKSNE